MLWILLYVRIGVCKYLCELKRMERNRKRLQSSMFSATECCYQVWLQNFKLKANRTQYYYHKLDLNSDSKMFLLVKFSSPTSWLLQGWFVMMLYCSRWITARWWWYCASFCSLSSPSPSRCVWPPQGGCHTDGIDGISPHLCSSLVISRYVSLLWCLLPDLPFFHAECPFWDQASLNNTNSKTPFLFLLS